MSKRFKSDVKYYFNDAKCIKKKNTFIVSVENKKYYAKTGVKAWELACNDLSSVFDNILFYIEPKGI